MVQRFSSSPLILSRPLGFRSSCSGEGASSSRGDADNHQRSSLILFIQRGRQNGANFLTL